MDSEGEIIYNMENKKGISSEIIAFTVLGALLLSFINIVVAVIFTGISLYTVFSLILSTFLLVICGSVWTLINLHILSEVANEQNNNIVQLTKYSTEALNVNKVFFNDYFIVPKNAVKEIANEVGDKSEDGQEQPN